jgi:predicted aldo/keto reductase-like oxidoreductase
VKKNIDRRSFLRIGAITGLASGVSVPALAIQGNKIGPQAGSQQTGVRQYVPLGKTGLNISDISFGASRLRSGQERLVEHAYDLGVNYFDTAESYSRGQSEPVIGNALKGKRDKVVIVSKTVTSSGTRQGAMMRSLEESLKNLQTDYIDIYFDHAVNDIDRLKNPEWRAFVDKARQQGKIRFTGMSGHAGHLAECVEYAAEHELFDVMLLAQNFGEDPNFYDRMTRSFDFVANQSRLPAAMEKAKKKGIGIVAMKVLRGAKLNDMRPFETGDATFAQAAFRWALNNKNVDAVIISMTSRNTIDEYLGASGSGEVTSEDMKLLEHYAQMTDMSYCRHACNDCEGACPYGVPIADVLRTRMYATDYGDFSFAKAEYAMLGNAASACLSCDGAPCKDACTHEIPIADLCGPTHQLLS